MGSVFKNSKARDCLRHALAFDETFPLETMKKSKIHLPRLPRGGEGSCEKIEDRLFPARSVRRGARSTQVERALRARFWSFYIFGAGGTPAPQPEATTASIVVQASSLQRRALPHA